MEDAHPFVLFSFHSLKLSPQYQNGNLRRFGGHSGDLTCSPINSQRAELEALCYFEIAKGVWKRK